MVREHEHRLEREFAFTVVEQVLERGPKQVNHHHVVIAFDSKPMHVRNAN